jgi:diguanylate cyclase (GGDEF)-like protein
MVDLDRFKDVNDTLGHEYGDRLLVELARRLSMKLRNCDTIARLGGDEFAILVLDADDDGATMAVAERLVELCEEPFHIDQFRLQVGASVGAAVAPDDAEDAESLMRQADAAMYEAKESGGGIVAHSGMSKDAGGTRIELLADLKRAVETDELVLHYQPRFDLRALRPVGVEALVRWQHPHRGILGPSEFIELAEVSGTIAALTRTVTERATADMAALRPGAPYTVNVNLSARNLHDPLLVDWVIDLLRRSDYPPMSLCFELTEAQLAEDPSQSLEVLHRLRLLGVRLSVDDFGSGYSSVSYLRELPIDEVKIDASFMRGLSAGDSTLVRSVIDLGHNLGLHVVAEGVEDHTSLEALRALGCDSAQGFHLAQPMPFEDLQRYFAQAGELTHSAGDA